MRSIFSLYSLSLHGKKKLCEAKEKITDHKEHQEHETALSADRGLFLRNNFYDINSNCPLEKKAFLQETQFTNLPLTTYNQFLQNNSKQRKNSYSYLRSYVLL